MSYISGGSWGPPILASKRGTSVCGMLSNSSNIKRKYISSYVNAYRQLPSSRGDLTNEPPASVQIQGMIPEFLRILKTSFSENHWRIRDLFRERAEGGGPFVICICCWFGGFQVRIDER